MTSNDGEKANTAQDTLDYLHKPLPGPKPRVTPTLNVISSSKITLVPTCYDPKTNAPVYHSFASGGYADLYKAEMTFADESVKVVAVKVFRGAHFSTHTEDQKDVYKNRLLREYEVWGRAKHRNILGLEGLVVVESLVLPSPGLVSQYKDHGDLHSFMQGSIIFDRLEMARGIVCGLEYLHNQIKVVHGDLTPVNILIDFDEATPCYFPLITDFGKSRVDGKRGYTTTVAEAVFVAARPPELLDHSDPNPATNAGVLSFAGDVYSFSMLLLYVLTGKVPYTQEGIAPLKILQLICDAAKPLRPTPEKYPLHNRESHNFCWSIMQACWKHRPEDRITSKSAYDLLHGHTTTLPFPSPPISV
ncbi:kinase-like protein [Coprinellus micaceus]|uniref:Kinase-like protein n=1 Tax=Coprinellus micaceus TaxID=71717 RepID=A0A4Y7SPY7_COPMI|nr:kinase-like protein [Coprinellus micaceus]